MITSCSPHWIVAERQVRAWSTRHGLVAGDAARRLGRMGHGRMAGWLAPDASPAELALLAQWGAFIALVDDGFDEGRHGPEQARELFDQVLGVLDGVDGSAHPVPVVRALTDLWARTAEATSPVWRGRFRALYRDFADATCTELRLRASGERLGLDDYLALRRRTITVLPVLAVLERALPDAPRLDGLRDAAADIVAWTNDLRSAARELEEGTDNLVTVLARHDRCGLAEAAAKARRMLADRMDDFDRLSDGGRAVPIRHARDGSLAWQRETHRNTTGSITLGDPWRGVRALARHLAVEVDADGVLDDRCGSRVLESALLLALLRATGSEPGERERLTRFLQDRRRTADPLDALLIDACLNPDEMADRALDRAAALPVVLGSGTAGRGRLKALMLRTVLHLLCGAPLDPGEVLPPTSPEDITTFTDVHLLSTRIINAHACGMAHSVSDAERDRLVSLLSLGRNRVLWEASATTHLLGLHAVRTFRPRAQVLDDGVLRLVLALGSDDGTPFLDSQDLWLTAVAGLAFLADDDLKPLVPRMAGFVAAWQAPDGGWPFATGMRQTDVDTTTRCMEFLHAADPVLYEDSLDRATAYLTAIADPGGGFPTWVSGDAPDLDMTAGAILALAPRAEQHEDLLAKAAEFVLAAQQPDGTWDRSWTVSESSGILRALDALHALPEPLPGVAEATRRAVDRLAATQNRDGGWGQRPGADSDVLSTAQALPAIARHGHRLDAGRALAWLLSRQHPDGGFTGPPDQVGPRPLPFDYPVLADVLVLSALHRTPGAPEQRRRRPAADWDALDSGLHGVLLRPEHAAYDQARLLVNQRFDHQRPRAIAYPAVVEDVVECVNFARANGIRLSLRSGGHSYAGYSTGQGLVVDFGALNSATAGGGRARFGAGAKAGPAHAALAAAGAGLPLGRCPTVGLAGVTLGGGLSSFTRAWGLACDHLREVEIVTADGRVRHCRPGDDLFWALCGGGGGNFGAVTALEFDTEDIRELSFTRFIVTWPGTDVADVLRGWTRWMADPATPRAVCAAFEQLSDSGQAALPVVTGAFIGTPAELGPVLDRLTAAVGRDETDRVAVPVSYVQAASEAERWGAGTWGPRVAFAAKSHIVREPLSPNASADLAAALSDLHGYTGVGGASGLLIDALGGAVNDRSRTATPFPHRDAIGVVQYHSYWHRFTDRTHVDRRTQWLRDVHATMQPHLGTGGYTNGMDPELTDWAAAYHAENYPRMRQVKAAVDPEQFFTFPQAVTPQPGTAMASTSSEILVRTPSTSENSCHPEELEPERSRTMRKPGATSRT